MVVIGGRISRLEAKRIEDNNITSQNLNFNVLDVSAEKRVIKVGYSGILDYAPKVAQITIEGELIFETADEKTAKAAMEEFKKNHKLPEAMMEEVLNAINYAVTATATLLSFGLNLPAPLNLPRIKVGKPSDAKAAS